MSVKQFQSLSKLAHVRLNLKEMSSNINYIKQNVINRKAQAYADPNLVENLYQEYRTQRHDLDMAINKRNQHNQLIKSIVTMEDDIKREKKLAEHHKVAKCMKTDIQNREQKVNDIET